MGILLSIKDYLRKKAMREREARYSVKFKPLSTDEKIRQALLKWGSFNKKKESDDKPS